MTHRLSTCLSLAVLCALAFPACGQQQPANAGQPAKSVNHADSSEPMQVTVSDGGSVVTDLGYEIQVNKGSSLHRSFVTINDPAAPLTLQNVGVATKYAGNRYDFRATGALLPREPIQAVEVRIVLFDVFGGRMKTLSATHVTDLQAQPVVIERWGTWYAWENDVSEFLTSVAFVANVRTASGHVWHFNDKRVGEELAKLNLKVTSGSLEPTKEERKP